MSAVGVSRGGDGASPPAALSVPARFSIHSTIAVHLKTTRRPIRK
jgi:hypothetical protein